MANNPKLTIELSALTGEAQTTRIDPVESLAQDASTIVSHLYSLQSAFETLDDGSFTQIQLLSTTKIELGQQWETWLDFFRQCLGHLRTCKLLYEVLQTDEITQVQAIASSTLANAASIRDKASSLPTLYKGMLTLLSSQMTETPTSHHAHTSQESNGSQYQLPNMIHEFESILSALQSCDKCLEDIASYWRDHHSKLCTIAGIRLDVKDLIVVEGPTVAMWASHHDLVRQAVSDITLCCDALTVTPPQRRKSKKSLRSRMSIGAPSSIAPPPLPSFSLMPPPLPSPPLERFRQENYLLLSKDQFDVPSIARASSQMAGRLQKLYFDKELPNKEVPAKYIQTFEHVVEVVEAGKVFYLNAGNLLRIPGAREAMHETATRTRTTLDKVLALWHELDSRNLNDGPDWKSIDSEDGRTESNGREHDPYVQEAVVCLVDKLTEFRKFWDKMVLELEGNYIQYLVRIDDQLKLPQKVWNLQVSHYRECIKEIREAQSLLLSTYTSNDTISPRHKSSRQRSMKSLLLMRLFCSVIPRGSKDTSHENDLLEEEKDHI